MRSVLVIGCGAVGASLARAIAGSKRHRVTGVHDTADERARSAAAALGVEALGDLGGPAASRAELVLVAVPAGQIGSVAAAAARAPAAHARQIWLHCDGREPASALGALSGMAKGLGTLHPACAFPPGEVTPLRPGCGFAISGDQAALAAGEALARDLGGFAVRIPGEARAAYHAAAVMASNCAVALVAAARGVLVERGIDPGEAERLLVALASGALAACGERGLEAGLSGPIRRGDAETVRGHVEALAGSKEALGIYRALGRAALTLARGTAGYRPEIAAEIERALAEGEDR